MISSAFEYGFPSIFENLNDDKIDYISKVKLYFKHENIVLKNSLPNSIVLKYQDSDVSKIIGNRGSNITRIREISGARIMIKDYGKSIRRIIVIANDYTINIVKAEFEKCVSCKGWYDIE